MSSPSPVLSKAPARSPERLGESTLKRLLPALGLIAVIAILIIVFRPTGTDSGPSNAECEELSAKVLVVATQVASTGESEYGLTEKERDTLLECIRQSAGTQ